MFVFFLLNDFNIPEESGAQLNIIDGSGSHRDRQD
jgi:hypothetical protein